MKATIEKLEPRKGFGFLIAEDGNKYFFHKEDFLGHWIDLVTDFGVMSQSIHLDFQPGRTSKGLRARNVNRLDFPNQHPVEMPFNQE